MNKLRHRLKYSLSISFIIYSFILSGNLSEDFRFGGVMPHEIIIFIFFIFVLFQNTSAAKWGNFIDKSYLVFFLGVVVLPILFNFEDFFGNDNFSKISTIFFYVKLWFFYRVFLYLIFYRLGINVYANITKVLEIFSNAASLAAFIGIARFIKLPFFYELIEKMWPIKADFLSDDWGRLVSTMGGTNTGGVFFAISSIVAMYLVLFAGNKRRLYQFVLFIITVVLSGSYTGIIVMISGILLLLFIQRGSIGFLKFVKFGVVSVIIIITVVNYTSIGNIVVGVVDKRSAEQFGDNSSILPISFLARFNDWQNLVPIVLENKPLSGYGFQENTMTGANTVNYDPRKSLTESYYVELLVVSGVIGLLSYFYFIIRLFLNIKRKSYNQPLQALLSTLIIMYLFAQISQPTMKYGGLNEFFGIIMAMVYITGVAPYNKSPYIRIRH